MSAPERKEKVKSKFVNETRFPHQMRLMGLSDDSLVRHQKDIGAESAAKETQVESLQWASPSRYSIRSSNTQLPSSPPQEHSIQYAIRNAMLSQECCRTHSNTRYAIRNVQQPPHSPRQSTPDTQCAIRNTQPAPGRHAEYADQKENTQPPNTQRKPLPWSPCPVL